MPDLKSRAMYAGIALTNVAYRATVYDPAASLEIGDDSYMAPVDQGRIIPVPQGLNQQQLLPYNRLTSENKDKTEKAIRYEQFAYQDYLGRAVE